MTTTQGSWEPNNKGKTIIAVIVLIIAIFILKLLGA